MVLSSEYSFWKVHTNNSGGEMKLVLLMTLLLSTNAFAKRSKKGGLYIEPIVGYSVYTKEKFEALGTTTDLSVGHGGTSYGARLGGRYWVFNDWC